MGLSNYPDGAYNDPRAPYNDVSIPEKEFDVTCQQVLKKTVSVITNQYTPYCDEGVDDGIGWYSEWYDTSETDWEREYHDNDYHTPLQLIELFRQHLQEQLSHGVVFKSPAFTERLIEECSDWIEDELEIYREDA